MRVISFLLADAAQESGGKVSVLGGGWNLIFGAQLPVVHRTISLVTVLAVGWNEANERIEFEINLVDADEKPVLPEGPLKGELTVGRPPQHPQGSDLQIPIVMNFDQVTFEGFGAYAFTLTLGGIEAARATFNVIPNR